MRLLYLLGSYVESKMCKLAVALLTISLMAVPGSARSNVKPECPAGYDLLGAVCQNGSTGDIVLPS